MSRVRVHRILGIDPGTACGWALLDAWRDRTWTLVASGTWDLSVKRHEGAGMRIVRLARHLEELIIAVNHPTLIGYEEVHRHLGTDAAHVYGAIVGQVQRVAEEFDVPYSGVPVATVKRKATGKGNAPKIAMVDAALALLKRPVSDDNEADALFVALCVGDL